MLCQAIMPFKAIIARMKNIKTHFVFDLDDTLTDSYAFNQQMFVDTFAPYVNILDSKIETYLRNLHYTNKGVAMILQFKQAIENFSLNLDPAELVKANEDLHIKNVQSITLFDEVVEIIKILNKKGKKISLMSNRQSQSLNKILRLNKLEKYLFRVISCSDEGHEKPDPYCLNKLIAESIEPKDSFIYFGDSKTDYEFAQSAGIDFIIIDHYINQKKFYKMIIQAFL